MRLSRPRWCNVILSDISIRKALAEGTIGIDPLGPNAVQPSSVDIRVSDAFRVFANHRYPFIDTRAEQPGLTEEVTATEAEPFMLHPGEFALASTLERLTLPDDIVAELTGKSSLGRLGLVVHATAGLVDPGWDGHITLELSNVATLPIAIYPGMPIGQFVFLRLDQPAERPYGSRELGSKYQGQQGPTPSRYFENFSD